jgi:Protein of unknown function (DUF4235)
VIAKIIYKPMGLAVSVLGGVLASAAFKRTWKLVGHEEQVPKATDRQRTWREVLPAAALQGAVFGLVKAAVDRAGARGFERATGAWPA